MRQSREAPRPVGFLVWNPDGRLPTASHGTWEKADAERGRLQALHPDSRFYVMAPVASQKAEKAADAFSRGRREGYDEARREVMHAETVADQISERAARLSACQAPAEHILDRADDFQATAADCLLWFDGFNAAFAGKESYERPATPDRDKLQQLNAALQRAARARQNAHAADDDDEIPF